MAACAARSGSAARRWPIDGHGWRDHSWGPRYWQAIFCYRLFIANFPDGDGFMLLKITDARGVSRRLGVLLVEGRYEEVLDLDLSTDWTDREDPPSSASASAPRGARPIITAEILTLAPLRNRRKTAEGETLVHGSPRALRASHGMAGGVTG